MLFSKSADASSGASRNTDRVTRADIAEVAGLNIMSRSGSYNAVKTATTVIGAFGGTFTAGAGYLIGSALTDAHALYQASSDVTDMNSLVMKRSELIGEIESQGALGSFSDGLSKGSSVFLGEASRVAEKKAGIKRKHAGANTVGEVLGEITKGVAMFTAGGAMGSTSQIATFLGTASLSDSITEGFGEYVQDGDARSAMATGGVMLVASLGINAISVGPLARMGKYISTINRPFVGTGMNAVMGGIEGGAYTTALEVSKWAGAEVVDEDYDINLLNIAVGTAAGMILAGGVSGLGYALKKGGAKTKVSPDGDEVKIADDLVDTEVPADNPLYDFMLKSRDEQKVLSEIKRYEGLLNRKLRDSSAPRNPLASNALPDVSVRRIAYDTVDSMARQDLGTDDILDIINTKMAYYDRSYATSNNLASVLNKVSQYAPFAENLPEARREVMLDLANSYRASYDSFLSDVVDSTNKDFYVHHMTGIPMNNPAFENYNAMNFIDPDTRIHEFESQNSVRLSERARKKALKNIEKGTLELKDSLLNKIRNSVLGYDRVEIEGSSSSMSIETGSSVDTGRKLDIGDTVSEGVDIRRDSHGVELEADMDVVTNKAGGETITVESVSETKEGVPFSKKADMFVLSDKSEQIQLSMVDSRGLRESEVLDDIDESMMTELIAFPVKEKSSSVDAGDHNMLDKGLKTKLNTEPKKKVKVKKKKEA